MSVWITVVETPAYLSKAEKIMTADERTKIVDEISAHPDAGILIKGTGGLRKLRIGLEGRGKRGGGRVIYWYHNTEYPAVLLWAFAKNETSDVSPGQLARLKQVADNLLRDFRRLT
jgi:hypothetical protein